MVDHENETMVLSYDYGDGWEIKLTLEKSTKTRNYPAKSCLAFLTATDMEFLRTAVVLEAWRMLAKVFKQKKGSRYKELSAWLGTDSLDLTAFDIDDMNNRLKKVPRIYSDIYEYGIEPTKQSLNLLMRKYKETNQRP